MPAETPPLKVSSPTNQFSSEKSRSKTPPLSPSDSCQNINNSNNNNNNNSNNNNNTNNNNNISSNSNTNTSSTSNISAGLNNNNGSNSSHQMQQSPRETSTSFSTSTSASSQQFCLRWNNYQTNLTNVFDQLLQNESFVDVTLACDGQSIKAHKMILSACSPYFQALFFDNPCQHPIIIMRDVKWPELKAIVEFMYKGEINVSQDQIGPLLKVAEMLKIRGLADVNGDQETSPASTSPNLNQNISGKNNFTEIGSSAITTTPANNSISTGNSNSNNSNTAKKAKLNRDWDMNALETTISTSNSSSNNISNRPRKRRWPSADNAAGDSPLGSMGTSGGPPTPENTGELTSPSATGIQNLPAMPHPPSTPNTIPPFPMTPSLESIGLSQLGISHADDMEIKPGIAEMIREEERAKLMENSHAWLGASTSSIADSYQYQLQSMWQKCWNTNQNLMHHLRFRERGPLKSWRPETMAEAIFSVLKEGLSLSQAARKYDIPYPTFVLYANRVHNMLGPSIDGGTDLRPKGRGRPQRILLGIWPDDHIKGVIKTVVFRDAKELKEEGIQLAYGRHSPVFPFQEGALNYAGAPCSNGLPSQTSGGSGGTESMSPEATAAAVAAVAHGIRQQMQMAAAAHHHDAANNLFNLPAHLHSSSSGNNNLPKQNSPSSSSTSGNSNISSSNQQQQHQTQQQQRHSSPLSSLPNSAAAAAAAAAALGLPPGMHFVPGLSSNANTSQTSSGCNNGASSSASSFSSSNSNSIVAQAHTSLNSSSSSSSSGNNLTSNALLRNSDSPSASAHDLRMNSPDDESPLHSPIDIPLEPAVNLAVGVSGMAYKPSRSYSPPRPEHLFQEDISDIVGNASRNCPPNMSTFKEPSQSIKIEPMAECRGE